jgi:signal transduction histidine kinase
MKENPIKPDFSAEKCSMSGLRISTKPEWTEVDFGGGYRANFSLLGDRIIVSRPSGFIGLNGLKASLVLLERIISETVGGKGPHILIEDMANLTGNSIEARRFYIAYLKQQKSLLGLFFCNISTFSKISFKLAKRLNVAPFQVEMVDTYADAVTLALGTLEKELIRTSEMREADPPGPNPVSAVKITAGKGCGFQENGYALDLEIIHGNILHSINSGFLKEMHIPMMERCRRKVFDTVEPGVQIDYFIASVEQLEGATPRARILYMNSLIKWHEDHPLKMMVLCGSNRFTRAAANLARPFMPFKVKTVSTLQEALQAVPRDDETRLKDHGTDRETSKMSDVPSHVEEILAYISQIRWDSEGPDFSSQPSPSHPFSAVFDAILLIKSELDQLLEERDLANKALRESRDGLEKRVAERTKELSLLNLKLQGEIFQHKKTLKELAESNRELKETQSQLIQSAKLASIGEMAAGVAHELNQPLMVARTGIQMMRRHGAYDTQKGDEAARQLELAEKSTKRMMTIIGHLQLFARQSPKDFEPVDVNHVIEESLLMMGEQLRIRGIEMKLELDSDLPRVMGNANHLEQVMLNLLTNARDALEETTESRGKWKGQKRIFLKTAVSSTEPEFIHVLVRDSGRGISPDAAEKVFDPFFTTKPVGKGTGLGLSISYGIIKDHQGEIEVAETGLKGTTFRVKLPFCSED